MSFFGSVWGLSPHSSYVLVLVKVWSEKKITQDRIGLRPIVVSTSITLSQSFLKSEKDATLSVLHMPADLKKSQMLFNTDIAFLSDQTQSLCTILPRATLKRPLCWISFPSSLLASEAKTASNFCCSWQLTGLWQFNWRIVSHMHTVCASSSIL